MRMIERKSNNEVLFRNSGGLPTRRTRISGLVFDDFVVIGIWKMLIINHNCKNALSYTNRPAIRIMTIEPEFGTKRFKHSQSHARVGVALGLRLGVHGRLVWPLADFFSWALAAGCSDRSCRTVNRLYSFDL